MHQKEHLHAGNVFYLKSYAFNGTTLVLRLDFLGEGLHHFDLFSSTGGIEEIKKTINFEVVKKERFIVLNCSNNQFCQIWARW